MMKAVALFVVLGACVLSAQAYRKCSYYGYQLPAVDLISNTLLSGKFGIIAASTRDSLVIPFASTCATTKFDFVLNQYTVATWDQLSQKSVHPTLNLYKDLTSNLFYYVKDGVKYYLVPFYREGNVLAYYICTDIEPSLLLANKDEAYVCVVDNVPGPLTKLQVTSPHVQQAIANAKKVGEQNLKFNWNLNNCDLAKCVDKVY